MVARIRSAWKKYRELKVGDAVQLAGEVGRCQIVLAAIREHREFVRDTFRHFHTMQLAEQWCHMIEFLTRQYPRHIFSLTNRSQ